MTVLVRATYRILPHHIRRAVLIEIGYGNDVPQVLTVQQRGGPWPMPNLNITSSRYAIIYQVAPLICHYISSPPA